MRETAGTLIFDGECGFCTRSRNFLAKIDNAHRIHTVPLQNPGAIQYADREMLQHTLHWVGPDGTVATGAEAVNIALSAALGMDLPLQVYRRIPGMRTLQERVYRWIADRRGRFPGVTPWCDTHPADCDRTGE